MSPRLKKFLSLFILLPGLTGYLLAATMLGERVPEFWLFQAAYYAIAGVAWAFPVKYLLRWMNAEPSQNGS